MEPKKLNNLCHHASPLFLQFNDLGLEALEAKLNKLDMDRAAEITRNTCASPTSLILALIYLDRMRSSNPSYLYSVSSTDLFLVSLVIITFYSVNILLLNPCVLSLLRLKLYG